MRAMLVDGASPLLRKVDRPAPEALADRREGRLTGAAVLTLH